MTNKTMVTFLILLLNLLLTQPVFAQDQSVELKNGSMEATRDGQPADWKFYGSSANAGFVLSHNTDEALVGDGCAVVDATGDEVNPQMFGNFVQNLDVKPWRGRTIRFRAAVRVTDTSKDGRAQLWFRIDGKATDGKSSIVAFDNMGDRPIKSSEWEHYEITSEVPDTSERLRVGMLVFKGCKAWIDDVSLETIESSDEPTTASTFSANTSSPIGGNVDSSQPFYNHWLWLAVITLTLFTISQIGRFGGAVKLSGELAEFGGLRKFALRFSVTYWLLYSLPSPFTSLLFSWGMKLHVWYKGVIDPIVHWTAINVLDIQRELPPPGGSGDTTFDFVRLLVCFAIAIGVAVVWSLVDRRKTDYRWINDLLRSYLRYVLAFTMLGYGLAKVGMVYNQFPEIGVSQLNKNWGDSSPMNAVWNLMGASRPYTIFAGLGECVGGLLLIWRRTTTLGAMVTFGVMLNVVMLNFCYDIPVKQYSFHLLVMALFLIMPEAHRLANILFWNRPTIAIKADPPYTGKVTIWFQRAIKAYIIIVGVGMPIYSKMLTELNYDPLASSGPAWFGAYEVEEYKFNDEVLPPLLSDNQRWKSVGLRRYLRPGGSGEFTDMLSVVAMDGSFSGGRCSVSEADQTLKCSTMAPSELQVKTKDDSIYEITGKIGTAEIVVKVRRVQRGDYLLVNRGYRWINEFPFNR